MRTKEIIQSFVGTSKIVLKDVYTDAETNAIVIKARPTKIEQCRCGLCHRKGKYYDKGQGERKPGRPVKGDVVNPEKKDAGALKNLRYVLLKNPENLSANQKDQLKFLTKANPGSIVPTC